MPKVNRASLLRMAHPLSLPSLPVWPPCFWAKIQRVLRPDVGSFPIFHLTKWRQPTRKAVWIRPFKTWINLTSFSLHNHSKSMLRSWWFKGLHCIGWKCYLIQKSHSSDSMPSMPDFFQFSASEAKVTMESTSVGCAGGLEAWRNKSVN